MKTNPKEPANPTRINSVNQGLNKLEYFAVVAMQGILANSYADEAGPRLAAEDIADIAVKQAQALIERLNK